MVFQLSPGVNITEIDLTTVVPAVATSDGAFAGVFRWGPVGERVFVDSENLLVSRFGKPTNFNAETFFTAANFLSYTNNLLTVRVDTGNHRNAVVTQTGTVTSITMDITGDSYVTAPAVLIGAPNIAGGVQATAHAVLSGDEIGRAHV